MNQNAITFVHHQNSLLSLATSILKCDEDAKDLVQDVFRELLEKNQAEQTRSYLFQLVRNRSLNKLRSRSRYEKALSRFRDAFDFLWPQQTSTNNHLIDELHNLPKPQQEIIMLRIHAELSVREIAEVLKIPEGTVKSRIHTALAQLRKNMKGRPHA